MNKTLIIIIAVVVLVGGGAFYGGMKYGQSKITGNFANLRNLSPEEQQQRLQQIGTGIAGFSGGRTGNQSGAGFVNGEIISKDNQSITVKMQDGSSKIVFYSGTTEISKLASGASSDLEVDKTVTINGTTNQDGSLTAKSIQLRPISVTQ